MLRSKAIQDLLYSIIFLLILSLLFSLVTALIIKFLGLNTTDLSSFIHVLSFLSMFLTGLFIAYRSTRWYLVFGTAFIYFSLVTGFHMWIVRELPDESFFYQILARVMVMIVSTVLLVALKKRKSEGEASYGL